MKDIVIYVFLSYYMKKCNNCYKIHFLPDDDICKKCKIGCLRCHSKKGIDDYGICSECRRDEKRNFCFKCNIKKILDDDGYCVTCYK